MVTLNVISQQVPCTVFRSTEKTVQQNAEIQAHYQVYPRIVKFFNVENARAEHTTCEKTVCEL